jgi:hypothetical protein
VKRDPQVHEAPAWLQAVLAGQRGAIARVLSQLERGERATASLSAALAPHLGRAHVLGITGAPGAGKSTLVHALLGELLARGKTLAVIAVDPSSPISGGAVLGDRVRMGEHGAHPDVFIRSVASRGHLGGLSQATSAMVDVLDAVGQFGDAGAGGGTDPQHRHFPARGGRAQVQHVLEVARGRLGAGQVGLGHHQQVGDLEDAGLERLHVVAEAGRTGHQPGVGHAHDLDFRLPGAHGLDDHHVEAGGVEHVDHR